MPPARGERWVFVKNGLGCCFRFGRLVLEKTPHPEIFLDRHARENRLILQDIGNTGLSQFFARRQSRHIRPRIPFTDQNAAGKNVVKTENCVKDRRFACAIGADQAQRLLTTNPQVNTVEDAHLAISCNQVIQGNIGMALYQRIQLLQADVFGNSSGLPGDFVD